MNDDELLGALGDALEPPERVPPTAQVAALRALIARHATDETDPTDLEPPSPAAPSRRTVLVGSIAAAVGGLAGVGATLAATSGDEPDEAAAVPTQPVEVTSLAPGATAEASTIDHTWGMELLLDVSGLPLDRRYAVSFTTESGEVAAGGFRSVDALMRCRFNATALRRDVREVVVADEASGDIVLRGRPA